MVPRFLMFETLAERTLALSQLEYRRHHERGYNPALERFLAPILARCLADNIKIVGNFGAANPLGAAQHIAALANRLYCERRGSLWSRATTSWVD